MLKGNTKVKQTPLLWQFCPPKRLFRKAANKATYVQCRGWFRVEGFKKPTLHTGIHSPSPGLMFSPCLNISKRSEAVQVGLEGPPKSSSPSGAAVDGYERAHSRSREGRLQDCSPWQLEFSRLESPSKPSRVSLLQPLRRELFQVQFMDCVCKGHPAELTQPGEADPLHDISLFFSFGLTALAWFWFTLTGGNESAVTVDFSARETYSLRSKNSNGERSGLNYKLISDGINNRTKLSTTSSSSLLFGHPRVTRQTKCLYETEEHM